MCCPNRDWRKKQESPAAEDFKQREGEGTLHPGRTRDSQTPWADGVSGDKEGDDPHMAMWPILSKDMSLSMASWQEKLLTPCS